MKRIAVLFSGQGSQYAGMGSKLHERDQATRALFDEASSVLDIDMRKLCFEASAADLGRTENTQPALLLCSVAAYREFVARTGVVPSLFAGHSLGELSALVAAEAMAFADGLRLARARGLAMSRAAVDGSSGMRAVTGLDQSVVEEVCRAVEGFGSELVIANYNSRSQFVLSGTLAALDRASEALKQVGGVAIPLKVSGAFHSPLMAPAADEYAVALAAITIARPKIPVVANVSARPHGEATTIAGMLVQQLTAPVRWSDSMAYMRSQSIECHVEAGPRAVLKKLALGNAPAAEAFALDEADDQAAIERYFAAEIRSMKERPSLIGKCLAVAVCTRNTNWDEDAYRQGVIEPYRELQAMQERFEREGIEPAVGDMKHALGLLDRIFATKGTAEDERRWRLAQILDSTGTRGLLVEHGFEPA